MATLGKNTATGTGPTSCGANYDWFFGPFTAPEDLTITDINIYSGGNLSTSKFVFGIYTDNGSNYPGTLIASTTEQSISFTGPGWVPSVTISAAITSGSKFWIGWNSSSSISLYYDSTGLTKYKLRTYNQSFVDPFPSGASSSVRTYSIYVNYTSGVTSSITIDSPIQYYTMQRDGSNQASIAISGSYSGSPTAIEARFNGGSWATIDSSLSGGSYSGTLSSQAAGQGALEVRFTNDTAVTASVADIGIGDVYLIAGHSQHAGRLTNYQAYSHASLKATMYRLSGTWAELADPTMTDATCGSIWPLLATLHMAATGYPVAFITTAVGGTTLLYGTTPGWATGGTNYNSALSKLTASEVNGLRAILMAVGGNDALYTTNQTDFQTAYSAFLDDFQTASGLSTLKMGVFQETRLTSVTRANLDPIKVAEGWLWDNDADCFNGPALSDLVGDGVHIVSDAEALIFAQRWWHFLKLKFFSGTEGRGPKVSAISKVSARVMRVVFTVANSPLQNQTDTTGWRVVDDTGVLTISSCASYGSTGVEITVSRDLDTNPLVSWGSYNDASGSTLTDTSTYDLPPEPFFDQTLSPYISLTDSTYIATSGSGTTTAQLTAPSGKTTSDFQAGKISDDTNPVAAIDLASGKYTELEFAVEVVTGLVANGDEIEFRITDNGTELDSYPLAYIPKITAGSGTESLSIFLFNINEIVKGQGPITAAQLGGLLVGA